jgi:hypothetical protein
MLRVAIRIGDASIVVCNLDSGAGGIGGGAEIGVEVSFGLECFVSADGVAWYRNFGDSPTVKGEVSNFNPTQGADVGEELLPGRRLQLGPYPGDPATVQLPRGSTVRLTGPVAVPAGQLGASLSFGRLRGERGSAGGHRPESARTDGAAVAPGTWLQVRVGIAEVTTEGPGRLLRRLDEPEPAQRDHLGRPGRGHGRRRREIALRAGAPEGRAARARPGPTGR